MYKQDIMEDFRKNAIDYKLLKKRVKIHSTAIVSSNAKIGDGSTIGAFSVIGDNVVIGNNCEIKSNVVIEGYTTIGDNNKIFPFAVIGEEPQDLKYSGEKSKIKIENYEEIALAPLAVLPEYQKQGIGSMLIEQGHKIAKKLGYHYSIVLGSENYYPKFGYIPAIQYGIQAPFDVANENFMALKLNATDTEIKGVVQYAKEFGI